MSAEIAHRVEQLIHGFWRALDRRDYDGLIALLNDDCRWLRGEWLQGKAAIRASLDARAADMTTLHLVTNILIEDEGESLRIHSIVTAFSGRGGSLPLPAGAPTLIADVDMRLLVSGTEIRIAEIEPSIPFMTTP